MVMDMCIFKDPFSLHFSLFGDGPGRKGWGGRGMRVEGGEQFCFFFFFRKADSNEDRWQMRRPGTPGFLQDGGLPGRPG